MNVVTHAQFCSDPVVASVIINLPRVSFPVSHRLLVVVRLTVVVGSTMSLATQGWIHAVCVIVVSVCRASASPWSSGDFARRLHSFRELQRHLTD